MNFASIRGSVQLPVFFLLWSAGVGWFSAQVHSRSPAAGPDVLSPSLAAVPDVADPLELNRNLKLALLESSEVISGRWHPSPAPGAAADQPQDASRGYAQLPGVAAQAADQAPSRRLAAVVAVLQSLPSEAPQPNAESVQLLAGTAQARGEASRPGLTSASGVTVAGEASGRARPPRAADAAADLRTAGAGSTLPAASPAAGSMVISRAPVDLEEVSRRARHETLKVNARTLLATDVAGNATRAYDLLLNDLDTLAEDDREYLGMLAVAALASGRYREARLTYDHLLQREPDNSRWWAGLAIVDEQLGQRGTSLVAYGNVARLSDLDSALGRFARMRTGSPPSLG